MSVRDLIWTSLPFLLQGTLTTLRVWAMSVLFSLALGLLVALARRSSNRVVVGVAQLYLSAFRGTPLLIQLMILYYGLTSFGILMTPLQAAVLGLTLHFGAYISETFRSAIGAVEHGQWEASLALGLSRRQAFRHVIMPQAFRIALPPLGNSMVDLVKSTSITSVIQVSELTRRADEISAGALVVMPILLVAALIYWVLTEVLSWILRLVERRLALPGM
jgi:L-cystine transport system permease protein